MQFSIDFPTKETPRFAQRGFPSNTTAMATFPYVSLLLIAGSCSSFVGIPNFVLRNFPLRLLPLLYSAIFLWSHLFPCSVLLLHGFPVEASLIRVHYKPIDWEKVEMSTAGD
ncbi:hypothetical protein HPP92_019649 [Vanilla planifolia]|uniref:Uncharacterized protein n=1 Tax=Vanilla planifolia TaxID=51239 RepID=A0A835PZX1_VANPL|nr:hypothetical protein HPP92_019649 [Vanilla planifolia]